MNVRERTWDLSHWAALGFWGLDPTSRPLEEGSPAASSSYLGRQGRAWGTPHSRLAWPGDRSPSGERAVPTPRRLYGPCCRGVPALQGCTAPDAGSMRTARPGSRRRVSGRAGTRHHPFWDPPHQKAPVAARWGPRAETSRSLPAPPAFCRPATLETPTPICPAASAGGHGFLSACLRRCRPGPPTGKTGGARHETRPSRGLGPQSCSSLWLCFHRLLLK